MISVESASITSAGLGPKKAVNEDSSLVLEREKVFAVADGVGGAQAGDVASQSALAALKDELRNNTPVTRVPDTIQLSKSLIEVANQKIFCLSRSRQISMASTIVLLVFGESSCVLAHVGDSRIYLYRQGKLLQLTRDHSKLQYLLDHAPRLDIDRDSYAEKNVITKALGVEDDVEPDIQRVNLKDRDIFVLCTDGVYNYNSEEEISQTLAKNPNNLNAACLDLKERCFAKGARDHLTAVVVKVTVQNPDLRETVKLRDNFAPKV